MEPRGDKRRLAAILAAEVLASRPAKRSVCVSVRN